MRTTPLTFDIFCRVVDNYGDIGVCWRLARDLARRPGCGALRLWVDDLASFARIARDIDPLEDEQQAQGVMVHRWTNEFAAVEPADVVIEAFACNLPEAFLARMTPRQIWINLEYLSAEDWVEACHALPSPQSGGLRKFFFFPGFTDATGGLLREPDLPARRDAWQADPSRRLALLERLGVGTDWCRRIQAGARLVYVYCYPQAPLQALLDGLASADRDALVLMPRGIWPEQQAREAYARNYVALHELPFVDQDVFDELLWSADINVVRGEDSLVRAIWAQRPMIWQPYLQDDDAHIRKLQAWLDRSPYPESIRGLMHDWNTGNAKRFGERLQESLQPPGLAEWIATAEAYSRELSAGDDLATRLLRFCAKHRQTR